MDAPAVKTVLRIDVSFAWWFSPYVRLLMLFAVLLDREPDWGKFDDMIERAVRLRIHKTD